jgi:hypothetical protein
MLLVCGFLEDIYDLKVSCLKSVMTTINAMLQAWLPEEVLVELKICSTVRREWMRKSSECGS